MPHRPCDLRHKPGSTHKAPRDPSGNSAHGLQDHAPWGNSAYGLQDHALWGNRSHGLQDYAPWGNRSHGYRTKSHRVPWAMGTVPHRPLFKGVAPSGSGPLFGGPVSEWPQCLYTCLHICPYAVWHMSKTDTSLPCNRHRCRCRSRSTVALYLRTQVRSVDRVRMNNWCLWCLGIL